ncbi:MAG: hypothetical protein IK054_02635 [Lachnospiraceae bacterium]|nr:hypothetical protein [Lachnospiraceae bacterium]
MKNNAKTVYNSLRIREGKTINAKIVPEDQALKTGSIENARELGGYINKSRNLSSCRTSSSSKKLI